LQEQKEEISEIKIDEPERNSKNKKSDTYKKAYINFRSVTNLELSKT
jgi:hypothetical protein